MFVNKLTHSPVVLIKYYKMLGAYHRNLSPNMFDTPGENCMAKLHLFLVVFSLYRKENSGKFKRQFQ